MQDSEIHKTSVNNVHIYAFISTLTYPSLGSPFPLLATTLRVDKHEQRMSVWHRADLLNDAQTNVMKPHTY